jgi:Fic family protein
MSSHVWTDQSGRSYHYRPYHAEPIAAMELDLSGPAVLAVAEASRLLGTVPSLPLAGIGAVLYRSESSASSIIEGLVAGPRRILEAEAALAGDLDDPIATRVVRNLEGLRDAIDTPLPARSPDLLRWHRLLTDDHPRMRREHIGAYRTEQIWIGGDASGPRNAAFIPPSPAHVAPLIEDLVGFAARTDLSPVVHAAIAHARFEVIHPFVDGNGRVGRMLLQHLLVRRLDLATPVPISIPWSWDTDAYIDGLRSYQSGDLNTWIKVAAAAIARAVDWMHRAADEIEALLTDLRSETRTRGESVAASVVNDLPRYPLVDAPSVAERYGVSRQAAYGALIRLSQAGVLSEQRFARRTKTGRPRRMFSNPALIDLLAALSSRPNGS